MPATRPSPSTTFVFRNRILTQTVVMMVVVVVVVRLAVQRRGCQLTFSLKISGVSTGVPHHTLDNTGGTGEADVS